MELYKELLTKVLAKQDVQVTFPNLHVDANAIVELECYRTLEQIKDIVADGRLDEQACYAKVRAIMSLLGSIVDR